MKLEKLLKTAAQQSGIPYETVLKDYAIGHLLAALAAEPLLRRSLVMKGGTALKKLYFGDYRFSEDLDFSGLDSPRGAELETALASVVARARETLEKAGQFFVTVDRVSHKGPHPAGQEDFVFRIQYPWQRQPLCTIKVEVTADEPILLPADERPILHGYEEPLAGSVRVYAVEEIIAEKLRALLQNEARREQRAWVRPRCRDFYDLWRLTRTYGATLDRAAVRRILPEKCAVRGVSYASAADFFPPGLVDVVSEAWDGDLGGLLAELPTAEEVIEELRPAVEKLLEEDPG